MGWEGREGGEEQRTKWKSQAEDVVEGEEEEEKEVKRERERGEEDRAE